MSKTKLTLSESQFKALPVAAELANVITGKAHKLGAVIKAEVEFKDAAALFHMGTLVHTIDEASISAYSAMKAEEKKVQEAKEEKALAAEKAKEKAPVKK